MFRLIKIENSYCDAPEILKLPKLEGTKIHAGIPLIMENYKIKPAYEMDTFEYMSVAEAGESDEYVFCHRITDNMLFEADTSDTKFSVGQRIAFACDADGTYVRGVSNGSGETVEVVDASDVKRTHSITIRFRFDTYYGG